MYSVSQASLSYHDDSSYDIATDNSNGESFDADDDDDDTSTQELTVNAAKQLQRAQGTAGIPMQEARRRTEDYRLKANYQEDQRSKC